MPSITSQIVSVVAAIAFLVLVFFLGYVSGKASLSTDIGEITGKVEQQNAHAKQLLSTLTAERDEKQAAIDNAYREQEKKDAQAKTDIDRLTAELNRRPVRVRIECPRGDGSSSTQNKKIARADYRAGNTSATYGVLPAANSERLARALKEIEQLSSAYNSCRSTLLVNQHMP